MLRRRQGGGLAWRAHIKLVAVPALASRVWSWAGGRSCAVVCALSGRAQGALRCFGSAGALAGCVPRRNGRHGGRWGPCDRVQGFGASQAQVEHLVVPPALLVTLLRVQVWSFWAAQVQLQLVITSSPAPSSSPTGLHRCRSPVP